MDEQPLDPSEIRELLLQEHAELRDRLLAYNALADAVPVTPEALVSLRRGLLDMLTFLEAHVAREESILVPALMEADAFGDVRTDILHAHHTHYAELANAARRDLEDTRAAADVVVGHCRVLSAHLAEEMAHEEATLLAPQVLHDDLVTTGLDG